MQFYGRLVAREKNASLKKKLEFENARFLDDESDINRLILVSDCTNATRVVYAVTSDSCNILQRYMVLSLFLNNTIWN